MKNRKDSIRAISKIWLILLPVFALAMVFGALYSLFRQLIHMKGVGNTSGYMTTASLEIQLSNDIHSERPSRGSRQTHA